MSSRNGAKPKSGGAATRRRTGDAADTGMTSLVDALIEFEDFRSTILPAIKKDLKAGLSAADLRKKYAGLVQARQITTALTSEDEGRASAAAKDIMDRAEGKATERKEVTHKYAELKDEELDAILQSEEEELKHMEEHLEH